MQVRRPINAVGVYVPGGTAVLPSSALMLTVPAAIAGCGTIVLATPPRADGSISPEVVYCARKAGATHVLKAGGAQAVAALGWGTEACPKVDKIFGPGNQFVTAAKMLLQNSEAMVAIDMPAGPSEARIRPPALCRFCLKGFQMRCARPPALPITPAIQPRTPEQTLATGRIGGTRTQVLVIADEGAPLAHVAADLLSQAEHGPDSQVVLVAMPGVDVDALGAEVARQAASLPRADTAAAALAHSYAVTVSGRDAAVAFSNAYAPEHLIVNTADAEEWLPALDNAGSVFLGRWTPESVGDYASGTNHVLPTYGYARMYSGVNLDAFCKKMTVQNLTRAGLDALGPAVAKMAEVEGLEAHRRAVTLRMDS